MFVFEASQGVVWEVYGNMGCPCFIGLLDQEVSQLNLVHIGIDVDIIPRPHVQALFN